MLTGSDGVLRGAPGGHPDTAAGSKCCIIVTPLVRGRMATVCKKVVTVTTPGDCVDVLVMDYGIAVNPARRDLIACLDAAGSKCCIIVTPLVRGRMATVCKKVVTVTTPGDCVDVLVTDYGIAVNPARRDLIACLDAAGIAHTTIEALQEKAYNLVGEPDELEWEDPVIAVLEARDGTILDVVRKIKPLVL